MKHPRSNNGDTQRPDSGRDTPSSNRVGLAQRPRAKPAAEADATRGDGAIRALAVALLPHLRDLLATHRQDGDLVDIVATVPAPRRAVMLAARQGRIKDACRVGRTWLAPRASVEAWLREGRPSVVENDTDHLEGLRASLARNGRR